MSIKKVITIATFVVCSFTLGNAQPTWFSPDPTKLRVPYNGTFSEGEKMRQTIQGLAPDIVVHLSRASQEVLLQAPAERISKIAWFLEQLGITLPTEAAPFRCQSEHRHETDAELGKGFQTSLGGIKKERNF